MRSFYDRFWQVNKDTKINHLFYNMDKILSVLPKNKKITILDYGCGYGEILLKLKKNNPRSTLIGMDVSNVALEISKKKVRQATYYHVRDGIKLPLKNTSIDYIIALDVIEHVYDTEMLFKEFSRILKPGGNIIISTPYYGLIKNIIIALIGYDTIYDPLGPHIRFFTKKSLKKCLENVAIKIYSIKYYGRFYPVYNAMYMLGKKK
jgi:ubiquinone/menaquinone biosynthesis C-methylase UbiE